MQFLMDSNISIKYQRRKIQTEINIEFTCLVFALANAYVCFEIRK